MQFCLREELNQAKKMVYLATDRLTLGSVVTQDYINLSECRQNSSNIGRDLETRATNHDAYC